MNRGKLWPDMTSYRVFEWLRAMFGPTWTLPNFTFGQLFMWIGANNDQIWLPMARWVILHDSFSDCFNILHRGAVLLEEYICRVNMAYMSKLGQILSAMFNSLMPSLNIRSLPFVVFMGGFPSRLQNLSSGAIRPGGLLFLLPMKKMFSGKKIF